MRAFLIASVAAFAISPVSAQQAAAPAAPAAQPAAPPAPMTFFVTSVGLDAGNLGGLVGADKQCQALAAKAGAGGKTWRAYLSTDPAPGKPAVNARDRIGKGPWHNAKGVLVARDVAHLHGDTLELAHEGNVIARMTALSETGGPINAVGDTPNWHDILTGSKYDGRSYSDGQDHTCKNWTSNNEGTAQLGHHDRNSGRNISWVSAHPSRGCSKDQLQASGGGGLFYCFATN